MVDLNRLLLSRLEEREIDLNTFALFGLKGTATRVLIEIEREIKKEDRK